MVVRMPRSMRRTWCTVHTMVNRTIRFGQAQGLEITADRYVQGHERLENTEIGLPDVIRKRGGAESHALTRLDDVLGVVPIANPVGLWFRWRELLVENGERLYALRTCADADPSTTGTFIDRGPWSRGTMRESVGAQTTSDIRSAVRLETPDAHCALDAWSVTGQGVLAQIRGEGAEDEITVDAAGDQVKGGMVGTGLSTSLGEQGLLTWQTTVDQIRGQLWRPGDATLLGASFSVFAAVMAGDADKQYDVFCEPVASGGFSVWAAITGTNQISVRARRTSSTFGPGNISATLNIVPGLVSTARHGCSVWVDPLPIGLDTYNVWVAASFASGGVNRYVVARCSYNVSTNVLALTGGPTANTTALSFPARPIAVAASWQNSVTVAHVAFGDSTTVFRNLTLGVGDASVRSLPSTAVVSGFRPLPAEDGRAFRNVLVLADITDDVLASALFLVDPFIGGDGSMAGRTTGEIYARSWVAQCRTTLGNLVGLFSLVRTGDALLWADSGRQAPNGAILRQMCVSRWTLQSTPVLPAHVSDYAVQAFGGYARLYDGVQTCEHDWHANPDFSLTGQAGGTLTAGALYTVAVSWRWTDATGRQHDGEPTIRTILLGGAQNTIRVTLNLLRWTERRGAVAAIWLSPANQSTLNLAATPFCAIDQITTTVATFNTDLTAPADTAAELLATDAIGGAQASITDFAVYAGGRIWAPSSRRDNVIQHSTFPAEGLAMRWDVDGLVELPTRATVINELEGRVVALGETRVSVLSGDGPDNTGGGDDYVLKDVPTTRGGRAQAGATPTPLGLLYDTGRGPRLLDRGLSVQDVGAAVAREYDLDGETVRCAAYDASRGVVQLVGERSGEVLIFGPETLRWARDVRESDVLAVAVDERGNVAWLRSSDVLIHAERTTYSPILASLYASSGLVPSHLFAGVRLADYVSGAALVLEGGTPPTRPEVTVVPGIYGRQSFGFSAAVDQAARCTDLAVCNVSSDLLVVAHVRLTSAANGTVAGKKSGLGVGWNAIRSGGLQRLTCTNSGGVGVTASLTAASDTVGQWRTLVFAIAPSASSLRIASDLELGSVAVLPAGLPFEAAAIPLRLGDSALAPLGFTAFDGELGALLAYRAQPGLNVATVDLLSLAQAHHAAWTLATGIPPTRDTRDGDVAQRLLFSTGWLRAEDAQGSTHLAFRQTAARLAGEYEGDHALVARLYADYNDSAPVATYRKSELDVALNHYAGRQYLYRFPAGGETGSYRAIRWEIEDSATETASFRASRLDLALEVLGPGQAEADEELDVPEV